MVLMAPALIWSVGRHTDFAKATLIQSDSKTSLKSKTSENQKADEMKQLLITIAAVVPVGLVIQGMCLR